MKYAGKNLESYMPTLKNPRVIVFNVPEDITPENAVQAIVLQNSGLDLNEQEIKPKFVFEDRKKHTNLVIEVNSETRKRLVDTKLKLGWHLCNSSDNLSVRRCYKCNKYNHRAQECFGDVVCPNCVQNHKMHECKASKENYRCVNCINYNKHNKTTQVNVNHSLLDKSCGCYKAVLKKYTGWITKMDNRTDRTNKEMKPLRCLQVNTLRTGLLNCLNARSRGLTFRHRASSI